MPTLPPAVSMLLALACLLGAGPTLRASGCVPIAASLCVGVDDFANVWINGQCVATCPAAPAGDFAFVPKGPGQAVNCVPVSLSLLDPSGANRIAVQVINSNPNQVWGAWVLTISCDGGGLSILSSAAPYDLYHDPSGAAPPASNAGLSWYDPHYAETFPWAAPVDVSATVFGAQPIDPSTGLAAPALSWDAAGDGPGADILYFRQDAPSPTPSPTPVQSPTQTPSFSASPSATPSPSITPTFTVSPTFTASPSISPTFTPLDYRSTLALLAAYPNPFADQVNVAFTLLSPGLLRWRVYNVAGELIASRSQGAQPGPGIIQWKGDNDAGARCASGVYLLRAVLDSPSASGDFWARLVIVR